MDAAWCRACHTAPHEQPHSPQREQSTKPKSKKKQKTNPTGEEGVKEARDKRRSVEKRSTDLQAIIKKKVGEKSQRAQKEDIALTLPTRVAKESVSPTETRSTKGLQLALEDPSTISSCACINHPLSFHNFFSFLPLLPLLLLPSGSSLKEKQRSSTSLVYLRRIIAKVASVSVKGDTSCSKLNLNSPLQIEFSRRRLSSDSTTCQITKTRHDTSKHPSLYKKEEKKIDRLGVGKVWGSLWAVEAMGCSADARPSSQARWTHAHLQTHIFKRIFQSSRTKKKRRRERRERRTFRDGLVGGKTHFFGRWFLSNAQKRKKKIRILPE